MLHFSAKIWVEKGGKSSTEGGFSCDEINSAETFTQGKQMTREWDLSGVHKGDYWCNAAAGLPAGYLAWAALGYSKAVPTGVAPVLDNILDTWTTWTLFKLFRKLKGFPLWSLYSCRALLGAQHYRVTCQVGQKLPTEQTTQLLQSCR